MTVLIIQSDQMDKSDGPLREFNYGLNFGSSGCIQETPYNL